MDSVLLSNYFKKFYYFTLLTIINISVFAAGNDDQGIVIQGFAIEGAHVFNEMELQALLTPYLGSNRRFADIQRALQTLQTHYQTHGYGETLISVPAQELNAGIIHFKIFEPILKSVAIDYQPQSLQNDYSEAQILSSLPDLKLNSLIRAENIAANLQLANENPAQKTEVLLDNGQQAGEFAAQIKVTGKPPRKFFATVDNTGTEQTGEYRMGYGMQHANLWQSGHIASFNYITPITTPDKVNLFSGSYRIPLYAWGDSIDLLAAKSDIGPITTSTVLGDLQFAGNGEIYALNYNFSLPRWGEYTQRLSTGINYRHFHNSCSLGHYGNQICGAIGHDIALMPLSLSYTGQWVQTQQALGFYLSGYHNLPGVANGEQTNFNLVRPAAVRGSGGAPAAYTLFKAGYQYSLSLANEWQIHLGGNSQYSPDALVYVEQFGMAGNAAVRGFWEREVARDIGFSLNQEFYTPNLASLIGAGDNMQALVFYDYGEGRNQPLRGESANSIKLSSTGFGLRFGYNQSFQLRFDGAYVLNGATSHQTGDVRGHLSVYMPYSF